MNPRIVGISGSLQGETFWIDESDLVFGRGKSCDVRFDDKTVSAKHCSIAFGGEYSFLVDFSRGATFVNGFYFPGKILVNGDRIRIARSVFMYLDSDDGEVDPASLKLTRAEEDWDRVTASAELPHGYEAAGAVVLDAFLDFSAAINGIRDSEEILSRVFEMIFRLIPVERVAILLARHDEDSFVSSAFRRIGSQNSNSFNVDDAVTLKTVRQAEPVVQEKVVCYPLTAFTTKVGVIYAVLPDYGGEFVTASHLRLLAAIAGTAAVALEHARYVAWLEGENQRLNEVIQIEHGMMGRSEKLNEVYRRVARAGPADGTVLITGESGTGKELLARAIHRNSPRNGQVFVAVNCAAFTEALLESELCGHEKSAFTGADKMKKGLVEVADGGTIFLDEIGDFSPSLQGHLLRILQEREIRRVGGTETIPVNVRVIAATNVDLEKAVKEGRFRQDLFFRLNVIQIQMPPLRERRSDIPLLAAHFIKKFGEKRAAPFPPVQGITPEAHHLLMSYAWPGNVRELENVIEHAMTLGASAYISPEDLPKQITGEALKPDDATLEKRLNACKKSIIEETLIGTGGDRNEAARILDVNPTYLAYLCKLFNLKWPPKGS
jgi:two-component system, NtrC family, response regulator HydG